MDIQHNYENDDTDDEEEDDGPAPMGSKMAKAKMMKSRSTFNSNNTLPANKDLTDITGKTKREEWMMVPGEHNFLKGVMSSGGMMKSRKFKNEKNRSGGGTTSSTMEQKPMNPQIKQTIDSIMDAHQAARGPSLIEQHREQMAQEKAAKAASKKGNDWNWSKKDLDDGRRVDKNYLHMVMGGASKDLKNKFQGSFSSGFT